MAGWTKRDFEDIEDRSPAELPMRWLLSRAASSGRSTSV
jgi:hypothetical protein